MNLSASVSLRPFWCYFPMLETCVLRTIFEFGALEWRSIVRVHLFWYAMYAEYLIQFRGRRVGRCGPSDFVYRN